MLTFRYAAVILTLPVVAFVAHIGCGVSFDIDIFQTRGARVQLEEEQKLHNHLDVVNRDILRRVTIKNELIADLISGRTTLVEVTRQFFVLNQSRSEYMTVIRQNYPGDTDEEKTANNVMGYIMAELAHVSPAYRDEVLNRLKMEFDIAYPAKAGRGSLGDHTPARKEANSGERQSSSS
ncbi:MAG: hypothetical protein C0467_19685 [Planctomycetaceae bacterium]|nr:hypothetical protein [Planctomycetaceae bacterium]